VYTSEPLFPLTVDQYHELIRSGKLTEADPVELLEGILVFKMPKNAPHATSNALARREIESKLPAGWHYRSQEPITLTDGEPEPDGAVVRGRIEDYASRHPGPAEVALLIEVADSSPDRDRGIKLRSYARAGVSEYWIVNLSERRVETYADPDSAGGFPSYRRALLFPAGSLVPLVIAGHRLGELAVAQMLA
jgi:Uma2 family endonuclease